MGKKRPVPYTKEYKLQLLREVGRFGSVKEIATKYGISPGALYNWKMKLQLYGEKAFQTQGKYIVDLKPLLIEENEGLLIKDDPTKDELNASELQKVIVQQALEISSLKMKVEELIKGSQDGKV